MRACVAAAENGQVARRLGNANAASDVEVGLELLRAGLRGARLNVEINLGSVKDSGYVEDVRREIQQLSESGADSRSQRVFVKKCVTTENSRPIVAPSPSSTKSSRSDSYDQ